MKCISFIALAVNAFNRGRTVMFSFIVDESRKSYDLICESMSILLGDLPATRVFVTDKWPALYSALKTVFPEGQHMLCHFHLLQAVRKKAMTFGANEGATYSIHFNF